VLQTIMTLFTGLSNEDLLAEGSRLAICARLAAHPGGCAAGGLAPRRRTLLLRRNARAVHRARDAGVSPRRAVRREGGATAKNIELRCRAHNAYEADLFFGAEVVRESRELWG
jgi:hypothetical protein